MYYYISSEENTLLRKARKKFNRNLTIRDMADDSNAAAWNQAAASVNSAAGIAAQSSAGKKTFRRNKEMMGIQFENQKALNIQGQQLGLDTWEKTSYPAQVKMMKEAGINPALMYGMGGGAGGSTATASGGSAQSGSTPNAPIDIGGAAAMGMTLAQNKMLSAQTRKVEAEGESIELDNKVKNTYGTEADTIEASNRRDKALSSGQMLFEGKEAGNKFEEEFGAEIQGRIDKAIGEGIENQMKRANIKLTDERRKAIWHEIRQKWTEAGFKGLNAIIGGVMKGGKR